MPKQNKQALTANLLRQSYLDYFGDKGHAIVPSSLLVPENDPTTLFTSSGMQPMIPYLLGEPHPKGNKITDSQKCFRAQDIEEVGDNRHTTFFEMLGNWSLGDYFKKEQLTWIFEFLTQVVGLDPAKLYVTVFGGDKEYDIEADHQAVKIWQELFESAGIKAEVEKNPQKTDISSHPDARIFFYGSDKNWWSRSGVPENMPPGEPGGPDSEIFYDFGPDFKFHENSLFADQPCHVNCDCGRFLEIGNSVFMQYQKTQSGFKELPQKNIDFGGGLERILAASQNQPDVFQTELFLPIIRKLEELTSTSYQDNKKQYRIITDHIKAAVMIIGDGVLPDNKDQGYMVRRLLRRAMRQTRLFSTQEKILPVLVETVINIYKKPYPELVSQQDKIIEIIDGESVKFERTLAKGLREFEKITQEKKLLTGEMAYHLYETYGFPLEILLEEAEMSEIQLDQKLHRDFEEAQQTHIQASKAGSAEKFKGGLADHSQRTTAYHTATHLLHQALRQVLGDHVEQKGSNINEKRLRFDFAHPQSLTDEEKSRIEAKINGWIDQDLPVHKITMSKNEALSSGALAFFAERYPQKVDVYVIGDAVTEAEKNPQEILQSEGIISKELCGGPHVSSTGSISHLKIFKEKSASAGVRRVYVKTVD